MIVEVCACVCLFVCACCLVVSYVYNQISNIYKLSTLMSLCFHITDELRAPRSGHGFYTIDRNMGGYFSSYLSGCGLHIIGRNNGMSLGLYMKLFGCKEVV